MTEERRWGWLVSRPTAMWQVLLSSLTAALACYATGRLLGHSQADALSFAAVFGGTSLLVQAWQVHRRNRTSPAADSTSHLPSHGGD